MSSAKQVSRQRANDITASVNSKSIAIVAIMKSSVFVLKKCPVIDLDENAISSIETLTFQAVTLFGDIIDFNYEGINARRVHRIIT